MAKEDLIEFTGVVAELLPNAMFRVKLDNDHDDPRPHLGQDAQEPHPRAGRRPRHRRDDALRPDQGPHHLPLQIGVGRPGDPAARPGLRFAAPARSACGRSGLSPTRSTPPTSTRRPLTARGAARLCAAHGDRQARRRRCAPSRRRRAGGRQRRRLRPAHPAQGRGRGEARACLTLLSGRRHRVLGGVADRRADGTVRTRLVETVVRFKRLERGRDRRLSRAAANGAARPAAMPSRAAPRASSLSSRAPTATSSACRCSRRWPC